MEAYARARPELVWSFGSELRGIYAVWLREFKVFQREKSRVISSLMTPLMWIFIFGGGLGASVTIPGTGGGAVDYQTYIYPGILTMAVMFSSIFYGLYVVWDKKVDVLKEVLVSPVSRLSIFAGKVLGGCTDASLQAAILLVIGVVAFKIDLGGLALAAVLILLASISLVALGLTIGSFFESFEGFQVIISFLAFPLFFLSGALFPLSESLPDWLHAIAKVNPLTYVVDGLRGSLLGSAFNVSGLLADFGAVVGFAAGMLVVGSWAFGRMKV